MTKQIERITGTLQIANSSIPLIIIRSNKRKRTIAFKLEADNGGLTILAPRRTAIKTLHDLAQQRSEWILQKIFELQQRKELEPKRKFISGEAFPYLGKNYNLQIEEASSQRNYCRLEQHELKVGIVYANNPDVDLRTRVVKKLVIHWYRKQALATITQQIAQWQMVLGVKPAKISITAALRRWGSCSSKNTICISWRIMLVPMPLVDYVVVHELCHIVHKNHSSAFWHLVASVMPDYRERRRQLRAYELDFI